MNALSERFEMRLDQDTLESVDVWRSKQPGVPTRSEAIRRLVERGLAAAGGGAVRFSQGETLLIHMMCEAFRTLKIKSEFDLKFLQSALFGGHYWALEWELPGTFHNHTDSPAVVTAVVDILDMWDFIEGSVEKLDKKERARLEKEAEPFGRDPKFRGFDGNNETDHMGVAMFLVRDMGRFSRFRGRELNSHWQSLETYGRMLKIFLPMRPKLTGGTMSVSQLAEVLNEQTHPSNRGKK